MLECVVNHEILAPVEEGGNYEVIDEDWDRYDRVKGEGENALLLTEGRVFRLLGDISSKDCKHGVDRLKKGEIRRETYEFSWKAPVKLLCSF